MANDDRQSQQFIREVDEEFRRAQLKAIWDRFAPLIIGVCILVVAVTAGYRGWLWWQERQAAQAGDRYLAALEAVEGSNPAEGEAALAEIAESEAGGYATLARLRLAAEQAEAGETAEAIAAYDAVAADGSASEPFRALARMRAALLALDAGDVAGARERASPLAVPGNTWRHLAREVLGTAAYEAGELQAARDYFTAIQEDAETPPDLWFRSGMMVALIDGQLAPPDQPEGAVDESGAADPPAVPGADGTEPEPAPAGAQAEEDAAAPTGETALPQEERAAGTPAPESPPEPSPAAASPQTPAIAPAPAAPEAPAAPPAPESPPDEAETTIPPQ